METPRVCSHPSKGSKWKFRLPSLPKMQCHPGGHWHPESLYNAKVMQDFVKIGSVAGFSGEGFLSRDILRCHLGCLLFSDVWRIHVHTYDEFHNARVYTGMILRRQGLWNFVLVSSPFLLDEINCWEHDLCRFFLILKSFRCGILS